MHPTAPDGPAIEDRDTPIRDLLGPFGKAVNTALPWDPWAFRHPCRSNPARKTDRAAFRQVRSGSKSKDKNFAVVSSTHRFPFRPSRYIQLRCPSKDNAVPTRVKPIRIRLGESVSSVQRTPSCISKCALEIGLQAFCANSQELGV